jgi:hypothetical protein
VAIFLSNRLSHTTRPAARPVPEGPPVLLLAADAAAGPTGLDRAGLRWLLAQVTSWLTAFTSGLRSGLVAVHHRPDRPDQGTGRAREELRQRNKEDPELLIPTVVKANETRICSSRCSTTSAGGTEGDRGPRS